jgi:ribonuclease G
LQFNDFGLVAITRKRVKQSLERTIGAPCPYCQSTGYVKSLTTVANEIYVEMRKIAKHLQREDVMLRVHPDVAKELKGSNGRLLNEMEELTKRTIIVKSDPALHQEQFDIN